MPKQKETDLPLSADLGSTVNDIDALVEAYQTIRQKLDALQINLAPSRDRQVIQLFALEEALFARIINGELEDLGSALQALCQAAEEANRVYISNREELFLSSKYYLSYLWRRIARVVYERTGRRKTIKTGAVMDLEMAKLNTQEEIIALVETYILQLSDELQLSNRGSTHILIENVKKYIDSHFSDDVSLTFVAEQVGFSSYYLSKLFKKETGINFREYVISVRMEKALQLINEGKLNINQIAAAVGYANANHFSQAFHKHHGFPPKAYQTRRIRPGK